jgi:hypothetical protein
MVETQELIAPETRARVEANALFEAVRQGDYQAAAVAQQRLKELGWHVSREQPAKRKGGR